MEINVGDYKKLKKLKKLLILSNIYDFIISIFKIKNIYITVFLVVLGIVSVLFFQKLIDEEKCWEFNNSLQFGYYCNKNKAGFEFRLPICS